MGSRVKSICWSLDMDGMDYWIWEAIEVVNPRVVVVEYQDMLGPDNALTVPYRDDFNAYVYPVTQGMPNFCGASCPRSPNWQKREAIVWLGAISTDTTPSSFAIRWGEPDPRDPNGRMLHAPKGLMGYERAPAHHGRLPWVEV